MKTKFLFLTLMAVVSTVSVLFAQENTSSENGLNALSFTEYLLMSLCTIMLVVIWLLARTIKSLSEQMR